MGAEAVLPALEALPSPCRVFLSLATHGLLCSYGRTYGRPTRATANDSESYQQGGMELQLKYRFRKRKKMKQNPKQSQILNAGISI